MIMLAAGNGAGKTMRLRIRGGQSQYGDPVAIVMLAGMLCVLGSALIYLGERVHAPEQTRMIVTGPPDPRCSSNEFQRE
jgi:hypothetical protein